MASARAPTSSKTPPLALLGTLLFAVAQSSLLLHGMVGHIRCADHGELVEARSSATTVAPTGDVDVLVQFAVGETQNDEHCPLALDPGISGPLGFAPVVFERVVAEVAPAVCAIVDSGFVLATHTPVFVIAPKPGPPAPPALILLPV